MLERWLREVELAFGGRVLGIDNMVSDQWGRMSAIRPVPVIDGLLAATALTNGLTLVTRNDRDIAGLGVTVLNPFKMSKITIDRSVGGSRIAKRPVAQIGALPESAFGMNCNPCVRVVQRRVGGPRPTMMSTMSTP